jgi:REP element-mobilizing transposase RayT
MKNRFVPEYTRKRPHFLRAGARLFVTCRLFGSIPKSDLHKLDKKYQEQIQLLEKRNPPDKELQLYLLQRAWFLEYDEMLHKIKTGPFWLAKPEIAKTLVDQLWRYHEKWYRLEAYTILSNHFHALLDFSVQVTPEGHIDEKNYHNLDKVIGLIKGASGFYANKILGRTKQSFWQEGYYDRYIRDAQHASSTINYIKQNPVKAGICLHWQEHPFTWAK